MLKYLSYSALAVLIVMGSYVSASEKSQDVGAYNMDIQVLSSAEQPSYLYENFIRALCVAPTHPSIGFYDPKLSMTILEKP